MIFYKITVIYWVIIVKYDICISIICAAVKVNESATRSRNLRSDHKPRPTGVEVTDT